MRMHTILQGGPYDGYLISLDWPPPDEVRLPVTVMFGGTVHDLAAATYIPDICVVDDEEREDTTHARALYVFKGVHESDESLMEDAIGEVPEVDWDSVHLAGYKGGSQ